VTETHDTGWLGAPQVSFVGAGPGDPGLLTVRALARLQSADVVIHDPEVPQTILRFVRAGAEVIDVGHASTGDSAQQAVSYLLAEKARERKRVVRLKWGDPFVFDRGAEEALFLREQGIACDVVPGVPASIAVPTYAGVPITGPGADTVTLVRGYEDDNRSLPEVDWSAIARLNGTVVSYLGSHQLPVVLDAMLAHGWDPEQPALLVHDGTLSTQESLAGTISSVRDLVRQNPKRTPGVLVVGRVAAFREHLRWFDRRPLFGKRVLVTRARAQAAELVERLEAVGAETVEAPMIRIVPPEDDTALRAAAAHPDLFDWIIFASANAVDAFMAAFLLEHRDVRSLNGPQLCTVGSGTADRLAHYGLAVDLVPDEFRAEAVVTALAAQGPLEGARILLPRADIGREVLAESLAARGAVITDVVAYRTILNPALRDEKPDVYGMLLAGAIDIVTFTSASAVRNFASTYGADQTSDLLRQTTVATIGPLTTEAATALGIAVTVQPTTYTIPALVDAIASHVIASRTA
jgi:uroporphyrinogen III methyltransferase/synthase